MKSSKVGLRYAKAALQQAIEDNNVKAVFEDMQGVHATVAESKELRLALQSPVIKSSDKEAVLLELFKGTQKTTQNLIKVMAANERTQYLGDVAAGFIGLYNDTQGVKVVKVTTAVALDGALVRGAALAMARCARTRIAIRYCTDSVPGTRVPLRGLIKAQKVKEASTRPPPCSHRKASQRSVLR